jgi:uncharacterized membrane protein
MTWIKRINSKEIKLNGLNLITKYFLLFLVCSVIGWLFEEIYFLIAEGNITKRGFLYGPYLPIYGAGAVLITWFLKKYKGNLFMVFIMAMLVSGILEYAIGYLILEIWNKRLWNYTDEFLNLQGFICFKSVFSFGIAGLGLIYIVEPLINNYILKLSKKLKILIICFISILFVLDFTFTMIFRYPL